MSKMQIIRDAASRAESLMLPDGSTWKAVFLGTYMGRIPDEVCEVPCMLEIVPESLDSGNHGKSIVRGDYLITTKPTQVLSALTGFEGEIDEQDRSFRFISANCEKRWVLHGRVSENGRVMYISIEFPSGGHSEEFCLIHEDVMDEVLPE